jgi:hypothetical protein
MCPGHAAVGYKGPRLSEGSDLWKLGSSSSHDDLASLWANCGGDLFDDELAPLDDLLFTDDGHGEEDAGHNQQQVGLDLHAHTQPHQPQAATHAAHDHHHSHHHISLAPTPTAVAPSEPSVCVAPITAA